ncbi:MAG: class I SAM-dependent rRNA methyltransferase [Saprospiraceae bacterium]|nr:class I SAM-dependent rRNA methyltransferase [Saprospiraceae bacterium]
MNQHQIILANGKERSLSRKHPWVFSGAIHSVNGKPEDGEVVRVTDRRGNFLAIGHYQGGGSISIRIISFDDIEIADQFWQKIILSAKQLRDSLGLTDNSQTNAYRIFHGEGDSIPGLIIDLYNDVAVIQSHSAGVLRGLSMIVKALEVVFENKIRVIYSRCQDTLHSPFTKGITDTFLKGDQEEVTIKENGILFSINVVTGQKTGFFLDQRENRQLLGQMSSGRSVLNCFCYTGGFSLYALLNGASKVDSVDISQKAMDLLEANLALNNITKNHTSHCTNVMEFLSNPEVPQYDIVIVDPPAFAKSLHKRHNAVQAYKRLNVQALQKVKSGGYLFTFSCSQVVGTQLFYDTIVAAGIESGKSIRVIHHLGQGPDHPTNLFHPEGHYLKGLVLYVED